MVVGEARARLRWSVLTSLVVSNYRSLGERVELKLGRMTALVGPNGAGKSNLADLIRFIAECARPRGLDEAISARNGFDSILRQGSPRPSHLTLAIQVEGPEFLWAWRFTLVSSEETKFEVLNEQALSVLRVAIKPGTLPLVTAALDAFAEPSFTGSPVNAIAPHLGNAEHGLSFLSGGALHLGGAMVRPTTRLQPSDRDLFLPYLEGSNTFFRDLPEWLCRMSVYSPSPGLLRSPQRLDTHRPLKTNGENWASVLADMQDQAGGTELLVALRHLVGDIQKFRVADLGGFLMPQFWHGKHVDDPGGYWLSAHQESEGTVRIAALLTALFQEPYLTLVGIEEPELAVHPGAMALLFDYLKEASSDSRSQVLLTTHSPDLLDLLDIDDVRIVERRAGSTLVSALDEDQRLAIRRRLFQPSEILRSEGLRPAEGQVNG